MIAMMTVSILYAVPTSIFVKPETIQKKLSLTCIIAQACATIISLVNPIRSL